MATTDDPTADGSSFDVSENGQKSSTLSGAYGRPSSPTEPICDNDGPRPAHGAPRRTAETFDGSVSFETDDGGHGEQWKNDSGAADTSPCLKSLSEPTNGERTPKGLPHGSRAATTWYKRDGGSIGADDGRGSELWRIQHDQMAVRDSESDSGKRKRRERLWHDLTRLLDGRMQGVLCYERDRARYLLLTDDYLDSSWNRHYNGLKGAAVGYAAVARFDSKADALREWGGESKLDLDGSEVTAAIGYAFRRMNDRDGV